MQIEILSSVSSNKMQVTLVSVLWCWHVWKWSLPHVSVPQIYRISS